MYIDVIKCNGNPKFKPPHFSGCVSGLADIQKMF